MKSILTSKLARRALTIGFYLAMIGFIALYIDRLDFSVLEGTTVNWWFIVAAMPFSILSRVFLPAIWVRIIGIYTDVSTRSDYWELNYIYAKAWLGKYIPGKVAWVAGKVYFAMDRGISKTVLGIASLMDAALQLITAALLGVVFLLVSGASSNFSAAYVAFFVFSTVVGVILISPPVFNNIMKHGYRIVRKKKFDEKYFISFADILRISPRYFVVYALSGLPIYFIIRALGYDLTIIETMYVSGAFIFAGAVGTLALFAPSGLGVREGVTLLFLADVLPVEVGLVVVAALRVWTVVLDLVYWVLSYLASSTLSRKKS